MLILSLLRRALLSVLGAVLLFICCALLFGALPHHRDFRSVPAGVPITLYTNGVHSGLALPIKAGGVDWRTIFPPSRTAAGQLQPGWDTMLVGWGDRKFYLETPSWGDLTAATAFSALSGLDSSVLHIEYQAAPKPSPDAITLTLSNESYQKLAAYIRASAVLEPNGSARWIAGHRYDRNDAFYEAYGHYSLFKTCNQWVRNALAEAGVRTPWWSPFDKALFWQLR